jgi:hypothetical protein
MFNKLKVFLFLFLLIFSSNVNAKPIPPGAGDGDVAANILFLVDSSASMGSWIGKDGIGQSFGVSYDAEGRILVGQCRFRGDSVRFKNCWNKFIFNR